MTFNDILSQTITMLQQHGRVSSRALKRQFALDDVFLEDLIYEITDVQHLAVAAAGPVLVWTGRAHTAMAPTPAPAALHGQAPRVAVPFSRTEQIRMTRTAFEGERKQITVLFADLKGSLELLADRDPEEARAFLDPVLERMMTAVHRYEGTVNQVMGDGIMALFGAPLAHEDHAVRACYAALAMQTAVHQYAAEVQRTHGVPIQIRVGLNAGEVVVRTMSNDLSVDYSAIGQTTHLAARMEQMAMPGSILLTQAVLDLAAGAVQVTPLGPVPVKGRTEPVAVFALVGARGSRRRFQAPAGRGLSQFVGRARELTVLLQAVERAATGAGQVVALSGEAGVGKSRLVYELLHTPHTQGWRVLESAAVSYGHAVPYMPVLDLLRRYTTIEEHDDPHVIRTKVATRVQTLDQTLRDTIPALLWLLDALPIDHPFLHLEPPQRRQRILEALTRVLLHESRRQPLVVVVEDLHWIDTETQAFLESLIASLSTAQLLLLITYRPEYQHHWGSQTSYTALRLDPLSPGSTEALLQSLLGDDCGCTALTQRLIARTGGNPFFLEESVQTLLETGIVVGLPGAYRLAQDVMTIQVPATVQAMLAARIDRLAAAEKQLLQTAAILGTEVSVPLLHAMTAVSEEALLGTLTCLRAAGFLDETQLFPERTFTFKHSLTHEVAYGSLLISRRQALHLAAGRALERLYAGRLEEAYERLAYHYARTTDSAKAVEYLTQVARKAARGYALVEAITALQEARRHVAQLPAAHRDHLALTLVLRQARLLTFLGRLPQTLELLLEVQGDLERLQEPELVGSYYALLSTTYSLTGDPQRATQYALRALTPAMQCGDHATLGRTYYVLSMEDMWRGQWSQGVEHGQQAIACLAQAQDQGWLGQAYWITGANHMFAGAFAQALAAEAQVQVIGEAIGTPRLQSYAAWTTGLTHTLMGAWEDGIKHCQRAVEQAPDPFCTAEAQGFLGYAYLEKGDAAAALSILEQAARQMHHMRFRQLESWFTIWWGEACLLDGQYARAQAFALQGMEIAREVSFQVAVGWGQRVVGQVALARHTYDEAGAQLRAALATFTAIASSTETARTLLILAALAHAQKDREAVTAHLHQAYTQFQTLQIPVYMGYTRQVATAYGLAISADPIKLGHNILALPRF